MLVIAVPTRMRAVADATACAYASESLKDSGMKTPAKPSSSARRDQARMSCGRAAPGAVGQRVAAARRRGVGGGGEGGGDPIHPSSLDYMAGQNPRGPSG